MIGIAIHLGALAIVLWFVLGVISIPEPWRTEPRDLDLPSRSQ